MCKFCNSDDDFQHAQDPWNTQAFQEEFPELANLPLPEPSAPNLSQIKKKPKHRVVKRKTKSPSSFVKTRGPRAEGLRLIQIKVIDLDKKQEAVNISDDENVVLSANYIVRDSVDSVMDSTTSLIQQISKSLLQDYY